MEKQRDFYFDNGKFLLIFFVVFGHLIRSFIAEHELLYAIYKTIYSFHMPAFILVSGHFAKGYYEKGYLLKLMKKLLIPYFIFQIIYSVYYYFLLDESQFSVNIFDPEWSLWFLISLFCWHLLLPLFTKLHPVTSFIFSIIIGVLIGYIDSIDTYLSLSRTFVFFPFFLLGYFLQREHFQHLKAKKTMMSSTIIILTIFIYFYSFPTMDFEWLFGSNPYSQLDNNFMFSWLQRLFIYGISFIMVFSFWALVPKQKFFFTKIGKYTLYIYLLHGFVVKYFRGSRFETWIAENHSLWILAVLALCLTLLLSSKCIRTIAQPMIELKTVYWQRLFKQFNQRLFS
ncbi:acyltransferase family protein [Bacillus andreraoultii]|uniref:acyltransferase family protein n=1 Tax=Bacillus andreraoultii TaxID=1499685 RepID=UPI00053A1D50|nr:acyltransferase family protein [Bacillus andreraoultii]